METVIFMGATAVRRGGLPFPPPLYVFVSQGLDMVLPYPRPKNIRELLLAVGSRERTVKDFGRVTMDTKIRIELSFMRYLIISRQPEMHSHGALYLVDEQSGALTLFRTNWDSSG